MKALNASPASSGKTPPAPDSAVRHFAYAEGDEKGLLPDFFCPHFSVKTHKQQSSKIVRKMGTERFIPDDISAFGMGLILNANWELVSLSHAPEPSPKSSSFLNSMVRVWFPESGPLSSDLARFSEI